jgi:hypothetical protein
VPGVVRQRELPNLEALIDAEAGRQPTRNLFILSCAIPAGIATFGGLTVFVAWLAGNKGLPLLLGTALTAVLTAGAWFIFYRLYRAVPPSTRHLRDLISKFSKRYGSFGNIILGEQALSDPFAALLDEAAGIYLRHAHEADNQGNEVSAKAVRALEDAMTRLMEVAMLKDQAAQNMAMASAMPILQELRLLDRSLTEHSLLAKREGLADPLARLRDVRAELETSNSAIQELDQHLESR